MQRIQSLSNSDTLPAPRTFSQAPGYFQPGALGVGRLPTQITSEWCNSVQEEIARAVEGAGITLDASQYGQLLAAINALATQRAAEVVGDVVEGGGVLPWSEATSYAAGDLVRGSNGAVYVALEVSAAVNPVGDESGKWEMLANLVHKSGSETISGVKTFSGDISMSGGALRRANNSGRLHLCGGTGTAQESGARISLIGSGESSAPGAFYILAQTADASVYMRGLPDGSLIWNGQPIQTASDERLKTDFGFFPGEVLDAWEAVQWQLFRFLAAKEAKGQDARWHAGLVAQRVKAVFEDRGLDACAFGILCHEVWQDEWEEREDGIRTLVRKAGEMWTIRYEEALAMEAACQRRRADRAEERLAGLERRLEELEAVLASLGGSHEDA